MEGTYTGSDQAGDKETRMSTSAGISMVGDDMVTANTRRFKKKNTRTSAEAELYAATLGAWE